MKNKKWMVVEHLKKNVQYNFLWHNIKKLTQSHYLILKNQSLLDILKYQFLNLILLLQKNEIKKIIAFSYCFNLFSIYGIILYL